MNGGAVMKLKTRQAQDAAASPPIQRLVAERPTYGYPLAGRRSLANAEKRRIMAPSLLNRRALRPPGDRRCDRRDLADRLDPLFATMVDDESAPSSD